MGTLLSELLLLLVDLKTLWAFFNIITREVCITTEGYSFEQSIHSVMFTMYFFVQLLSIVRHFISEDSNGYFQIVDGLCCHSALSEKNRLFRCNLSPQNFGQEF
ncbi:hypothetical protein CEXT_188451 [Caerostris extrusa]|uniref:Uncharacterized protein n=1 Tax=Caerostris extrusa TaxID=172846 RepID=A0AAV4ND45_CAEEX|nr:hypothetical protein CEXT_188451 [Caerostris extrusa]